MVWCIHTRVALHSIKTQSTVLSITWTSFYEQSLIICGILDGQLISVMVEKVLNLLVFENLQFANLTRNC